MPFTLVRYSQQDPRWKDYTLGSGPGTVEQIGSALTCLAMYSSGWGFTETPGTLSRRLKNAGGFDGQQLLWGSLNKLHSSLRFGGLTQCASTPAPLRRLEVAMDNGQPVMVEVDFSPVVGLQTHWVLLYGRKGDDFLMLDPWPLPVEQDEATLMSRYSQGAPLDRAIKAVAWWQGTEASPEGEQALASTDLYVQPLATITAGLRLHSQPSADSAAIYAEMPGVRLNVTETKALALAKLGRQGEWIRVRDPQGNQGYVPASAVEQARGVAAVQLPMPEHASQPKLFEVVVLKSIGAFGLAVRESPDRHSAKVGIAKAGARLSVLEPANVGIAKLGRHGEWVAINIGRNRRGYVAAEYVELPS